jgi:D-3-phosphoglycerate dehydrogenase / 2-oxoglutarate reductase
LDELMADAAVRDRQPGAEPGSVDSPTQRVLVAEPIAESGIELLRREFDVELGFELTQDELGERIGEFDALLIRSGTKVTAELIARAERLKVIGRAGTGVDNVDVEAATKRGIIVANAPESNSVAAAEHTIALALALYRNVPRAHASLAAGRWERSEFKGRELYGKTLGVIGFGRIGQLVAQRAMAFRMEVVAYDKFVAAERFRELGIEGVGSTEELYRRADIITIHLPRTAETVNWIDADAISRMKPGVMIINAARGELVDLEALEQGLESGKIAGAALDVFPEEPMTDHPLFGRRDVVVTPHLGAATEEAQDRAGVITAEQVRAALAGGVVTNAVNIYAVRREAMEALAPFVPLCEKLGRLAQGLGNGSIDRVQAEFRGRLAEHDTRLLGIAVLVGILSGHTEEPVNLVNAPAMATERGIELVELKDTVSDEFTELVTVRIESGKDVVEVAGTAVGPRNLPHLVRVWGESFYMPFAEHLAIFRYRDQPGMIGRVGTAFGQHGVNIVSAAVGAEANPDQAVMALTTDAEVPDEVIDEIASTADFDIGRAVDL